MKKGLLLLKVTSPTLEKTHVHPATTKNLTGPKHLQRVHPLGDLEDDKFGLFSIT